MGKALKTAGVIIGAAALIATGVGALAMPGLAGSTTLFGISTGTLNTISSGLIAVGGMLDKPKSQGSAQPDEWTSNPDQPIPFLFGRMGVAGKIVQRDEFGPDNMYQGIVGIISGAGPIKGIQSFKGDDQAVTFGANGIAVSSQWQGEMWMVRRSGAQPDTVLAVPAGLKSGGQSFEWSSSAKLSGKACYLQVLGENSKGSAYPAGIPDPVHVGEGIYGYDPRYDSTYPGGEGSCRFGVRSTYRYIEDPIIAGLNWALGMVENGQVVGGVGASVDGIDIPAFVEAANISEANGWKVAAWPDTSEDVSSVLDQFLQAGGAVRARHAGKISCVSRGAPRASVVTVTARDLAGSIELNTAPSLFDQLNTITPRFMSEAGGWKLTPADPVSFDAYVEADGGKHSDQIDYRFCPLLKQAAELAAYDILDAREPFSGSVPLKPHLRLLRPGDCFDIDEPGVLLDGVKCIVLSRAYDPKTAQVRIGFRSETDGKHDLALGKTTTLPEFPELTPVDPTYVSPPLPEDWVIEPRPPAEDGTQISGFDLSGLVSNATATAVIVEWGPAEDGPWTQAYAGPPDVTSIPIVGLQSGQTYYIAVRYQRDSNFSDRYVYGPYVAPTLTAGVSPEDPIWAELLGAAKDLLQNSIEDAQALLEEERNRDRSVVDVLDRIGLGFVLDPVERTALIKTETVAQGVGPGGVSETLVQMTTRLTAVDALNAAATSQALIDAQAYTNAYAASAALTFATQAGVSSSLAAAQGQWESYATSAAASAIIGLATTAQVDSAVAASALSLQSYVDSEVSTATADLVSASEMAGAISTSALSLQSYTNSQISTAVADLVSTSTLASSLATAQGQWESYATAAAASAIIGLDTIAAREGALAVAQGQWESYADDAAASATAGLDTVAAREAAVAASALSLQSYTNSQITTATATLATQTSLNGVSAIASLALSTANGNEAYAALSVDANGWLTALRVNGVSRSIDFVSEVFSLRSSSSGIRSEYRGGVWYIYDPDAGVRTMYGKSFGGAAKLQWWTGPASIAEGSETKANAFVYIAMTAPRFGGSDVVASGGAVSYAEGTVSVFRTTSPETAAQLTATGTVLVEASVTSVSEDGVAAPIVTADVVGVSSGGAETVLARKSMGSGLPDDPLVHTFAPVQGAYPIYRVKVQGGGPVSSDGEAIVDVTLKTTPVTTA